MLTPAPQPTSRARGEEETAALIWGREMTSYASPGDMLVSLEAVKLFVFSRRLYPDDLKSSIDVSSANVSLGFIIGIIGITGITGITWGITWDKCFNSDLRVTFLVTEDEDDNKVDVNKVDVDKVDVNVRCCGRCGRIRRGTLLK